MSADSLRSNSRWTTATRWTWIALVLPLLALSPLLYMQCHALMLKPHLQFFPLAIAASIYFIGFDRSVDRSPQNRPWAFPLWVATVLLSLLALYLGSPWLAHFCAIALLGVWGLVARPQLSNLRLSGICGLLLVTLPPPFGWDKKLVGGLQAFSSVACSRLMDLTQIVHVRRGNIIEVSSKPLFVEEACSGVDSQYALMAVAGVLLLLGRAGWPVSLLTIVTVPIWAILGNLLRIYLIVIGLEWIGVDFSNGTTHTVLGLSVFIFTAWVHWSSVQLLNYLQLTLFRVPKDDEPEHGDSFCDGNELANNTKLRYAWSMLPLCLFFFFPESVRAVVDFHASSDLPSISLEDSEKFPGIGGLVTGNGVQFVGFHTAYRDRNDMLGQHSRIWELQSETGRMTVCLDFPFRGWHPLWECYINSGWQRQTTEMIGAEDESFFETILRNDLGDLAVLHFSLFDENGEPYTYEGSFEFRKQAKRWTNTLFKRKRPGERVEEPMTFQFQQIAYTGAPPSEDQLDLLRRTFLESRRQIVSQSGTALRRLKSPSFDVTN